MHRFERFEPQFAPVDAIDGYLPLEHYGLIGDGTTAALVGRNGSLDWLCVPRFDDPPLFCRLLDHRRGGGFRLAPRELTEARQYYVPDSGVLVTEMRSTGGLVKLTDALTLRSGAVLTEGVTADRQELLRLVEVLEGKVHLQIEVAPRGECRARRRADGWELVCARHPELDLQLYADRELEGPTSELELNQGETMAVFLRWGEGARHYHPLTPENVLDATIDAWRRWIGCFHYRGPQEPLVRRATITLKLLDHFANGAILAAPTSSLPEAIGGPRNWDYRYAWIRDAAFSVYALRRVGLTREAAAFLGWVLDTVENEGRPRVLYNLRGDQPPPEYEDDQLEGYRGSQPVRWGNGAADQRQHDVFGEILDCAFQWADPGDGLHPRLWKRLCEFIEAARDEWHEPDHGIWEVRTSTRPFTYSAALCQVALDRGARLVARLSLPGDAEGWKRDAKRIRDAILDEAWDPQQQSLTEHLGGGALDASLLCLPLRRVLDANHPKMVATTQAVAARLSAGDGLIYRYLPDESPDGLEGDEGAFLLCSFWFVDNLAKQRRLHEAAELYESLCARTNDLGLLPEQIDPESGAFLGNYPQAFSHVGLISSGVNLARSQPNKAR